jgi:hypothetical protein
VKCKQEAGGWVGVEGVEGVEGHVDGHQEEMSDAGNGLDTSNISHLEDVEL